MSREIGLVELGALLRRRWALVAGLAALTGLLAAGALAVLEPPIYRARATLVVNPPTAETEQQRIPMAIYRNHLMSENIVQRTTRELIREGVLPEGAVLRQGRQIDSTLVSGSQEPRRSSLLVLLAFDSDPAVAATVANTWARVFVEASHGLFQGTAAASETALREQMAPARQRLQEAEAERSRRLDEFQAREEEASTSWDQRVSRAIKKAEEALATYHAETRNLMQAAVDRVEVDTSSASASAEGPAQQNLEQTVRSLLLEVLSTRAQLAQTPRVLSLEKAASDETLAELIATGTSAEFLNNTLTTQEINPLYDQLTVAILGLESKLKRIAGPPVRGLEGVLRELEAIQRDRAAGLAVLLETAKLEIRTLRRRRSRALEDLARDRATAVAEIERSLAQMKDLDDLMSQELNRAVVSSLLGEVELVGLSAPAVAPQVAQPRRVVLKVAAAVFLGGILGLFVALFQSVQAPPPVD